ncbi:glycosyltransferase involved in cell wall biosynthesis [Lysobacter niastensis]|uniref:Glycosyltransferase involved in cell wall biosynthesis n=1 Tax=Lysobacter niastensis TaxID=380629 RepID=A0ABU1WCA8_9GAMM|nr:rhamnan synthesis F family protein [Lysobacter niastensis]MDR7135222.1 glycosyltransferase involved in cell wall biosynthesis [Lysobacter niastensis]
MIDRNSPRRFNARWYLERYPDVARSGMDPREHYRLFGKPEGRLPGPEPTWKRTLHEFHKLWTTAIAVVRHAGGVRPAIGKAMQVAQRTGWYEPEFDEAFYLQQYPDVLHSGVDPYQHFIEHGRAEGRIAVRPKLARVEGGAVPNPDRPTVLVVSHEASLTGAPILSLNVVRGLRDKYNVVTLLLGEGPLEPVFREESVVVAGPVKLRHSAPIVADAIAQLVEGHSFAFAIVNSIESVMALEPLARRSVPTVTLIHEFATYTRPRSAFRNAFFWADEVVFSTRLTHADALANHSELAEKRCHILPQGRCSVFTDSSVDPAERTDELTRVRKFMRPEAESGDFLLVVGIGSVHIRKGVEYFIECAAQVMKAQAARQCRFVWVGKGYDPEQDMAYSIYLADQIRRSGLEGHIDFMGDTREIDEVYASCDLLLLTSRLDPLPNVAIDAMTHAVPVLCFDQTTGIAEILADNGMREHCVAEYLDTVDMAAKVVAFANSEELRRNIGTRLQEIASDTFDMESYIQALDGIAGEARARVAREQENAREIHKSALMHEDYVVARDGEFDVEAIRWDYLRPWSSGILPRKPFPGFHPGVFSEHHADVLTSDPLVHYLRAGRPSGQWQLDVITAEEPAQALPSNARVALHLHVYYPELLTEMLKRLGVNRVRPDLLISVPNEGARDHVANELQRYAAKYVIEIVPNRGRDIGPFLTGFGPMIMNDYDFVGHLHTKKTADVADASMAEQWRGFLFENLLGGKAPMADIILGRMAADATIGMVFPDDPHAVGWGSNLSHARTLARRLGLTDTLPRQFVFPIGTMFWARVDALRPLFDLGLEWGDYPSEPLPYDGSMLHALERLLPFVVSERGARNVLTNVAGITR